MKTLMLAAALAIPSGAVHAGSIVLYEGTLTDSSGLEKTGTFLLNFRIGSGADVWKDAVFVRAREGRYRTTLGAEKAIPERFLKGAIRIEAAAPHGADWISREAKAPLVVRGGTASASASDSPKKKPRAKKTIRASSPAAADEPRIEFSGTLEDAQGRPKSGTFLMNFRIYPGVSGEKLAWQSARYVRIENGRFRAELGEKKALPVETLRGSYRIKAMPPAGLGWRAKASGVPILRGLPAPRATSGDAASGELERMRREMRRVRDEARKAKKAAESSKRQIEALEEKVLRSGAGSAVPARKSRVYVVRPGETLKSISKKLFGSDGRWIEIYQANHDRVLRGGEVVPGQRLLIPKQGR
jgi:hypothetical protein